MIENWASSLPGVEDRTGASEADRSYNFNSDFPRAAVLKRQARTTT